MWKTIGARKPSETKGGGYETSHNKDKDRYQTVWFRKEEGREGRPILSLVGVKQNTKKQHNPGSKWTGMKKRIEGGEKEPD